MERKTTIKIILTKQFQLKIVLLHSNKQEEVVRLKDNKEELKILFILFKI